VAMVLFVLALGRPILPEGHPLLHYMRLMLRPLHVSSVRSGTIAGTASGQFPRVICCQGSGFDYLG
jgi:hypothetical protein